MRNVSLMVTSDHFLFVVYVDNICEEMTMNEFTTPDIQNEGQGNNLYNSDSVATTRAMAITNYFIGFGVQGSQNTFFWNSNNSIWDHFSSTTMPYLDSRHRDGHIDILGAVAASNGTMYVGVVPKDISISSDFIEMAKEVASNDEIYLLQQNTNTAFQIMQICQTPTKRDLNNFDELVPTEETIPDSEVTII